MKTCEHNALNICNLPLVEPRKLESNIDRHRESLVRYIEKKWVNHTLLHFYFMQDQPHLAGSANQLQAVRDAFEEWKQLGIGLDFIEVSQASEAEFRIGFNPGSSWSYVGRDCIDLVPNHQDQTMNFGWDLTTPYGRDTALHEIGHAMGFPHEHQNYKAGIVWDEDAVYTSFAGYPNYWDEATTYHNIIRKISAQDATGSSWDRDSIMHYQFDAGLILSPAEYQQQPLIPAPGLSEMDVQEALKFYPDNNATQWPQLQPFLSHKLNIMPGEQLDFIIEPEASRTYNIQTFGGFDTVIVLFEDDDGEPIYLAGDDDSGTHYNSKITLRLISSRRYYLRLRLYSAGASGEGGVMVW